MNDQAPPLPILILWRFAISLFMTGGFLMVLISLALLVKTTVFVAKSEVTVGKIERIEPREGRSVQYVPIYSFADDSKVMRRNEGVFCSRDRWTTAQQVSVRYMPGDAGNSALNTFHDIWMVPLMVFVFSAGYLAFMLWQHRKMWNRTKRGIRPLPTI